MPKRDNILAYQKTWTEINNDIAQKIVRLRKRKKITQKQLAARSGVSLGSLKRFEQSGEISLQSLTKIAIALDVENELEDLFNNVPFASIEEVINEQTK
jgi:transcriptional regulator with XRE-family HTH domain